MSTGHVEWTTRQAATPVAAATPAADGVFDVAPFVREIGRGGKGARSLDPMRARELFAALFDGRLEPLALGAVLVALRMKGESVDEVDGALAALDPHVNKVPVDARRPAVAIPSYNGARHLANLTPLLACLLADAGVQVVVHGVTDDAARTTTHRILLAMGIQPVEHVDDAANLLARSEPAFVPVDLLAPPLARLLALRQRLGVRNVGHTLAKLVDPCTGSHCLRMSSFTHPEFDDLQHRLFARLGRPALVMRGTEGEVVANAKRRARIDFIHDGRVDTLLEAETLPLGEVPSLPPAHDAVATAGWIQSVLAGERPVPPSIASQVDCVLQALQGTGESLPATDPPAAAPSDRAAIPRRVLGEDGVPGVPPPAGRGRDAAGRIGL